VEDKFFHEDGQDRQTDGQKDRHGEANSRFPQFCERAWQKTIIPLNNINQSVFRAETGCVLCEVGTSSLNSLISFQSSEL
jgi:hypothetical protein